MKNQQFREEIFTNEKFGSIQIPGRYSLGQYVRFPTMQCQVFQLSPPPKTASCWTTNGRFSSRPYGTCEQWPQSLATNEWFGSVVIDIKCLRLISVRAPPPNNLRILYNSHFFLPPLNIFLVNQLKKGFQFTFNWFQFTFNWFQFTFNWLIYFQLISIYFQFTSIYESKLKVNWNQLKVNWK